MSELDNKLYSQILAVEGRPPQSTEFNKVQETIKSFLLRFYKAKFPETFGNFNHTELPEISLSSDYLQDDTTSEYYIEVSGSDSYLGLSDNIYKISFKENLIVHMPSIETTAEHVYATIVSHTVTAEEDTALLNPTKNLPSSGRIGADRICSNIWFYHFPNVVKGSTTTTSGRTVLELDDAYVNSEGTRADIHYRCPFCGQESKQWSAWTSADYKCTSCGNDIYSLYELILGSEQNIGIYTYSKSHSVATYLGTTLSSSVANTIDKGISTFFLENIKKTFSNIVVKGMEITGDYKKTNTNSGTLTIYVSAGICLIDGFLYELKEPAVFEIDYADTSSSHISDAISKTIYEYIRPSSSRMSLSVPDWPLESVSKNESTYNSLSSCSINNFSLQKGIFASEVTCTKSSDLPITSGGVPLKYKRYLWDLYTLYVNDINDTYKTESYFLGTYNHSGTSFEQCARIKNPIYRNTVTFNSRNDSGFNFLPIYIFNSNNTQVNLTDIKGTISVVSSNTKIATVEYSINGNYIRIRPTYSTYGTVTISLFIDGKAISTFNIKFQLDHTTKAIGVISGTKVESTSLFLGVGTNTIQPTYRDNIYVKKSTSSVILSLYNINNEDSKVFDFQSLDKLSGDITDITVISSDKNIATASITKVKEGVSYITCTLKGLGGNTTIYVLQDGLIIDSIRITVSPASGSGIISGTKVTTNKRGYAYLYPLDNMSTIDRQPLVLGYELSDKSDGYVDLELPTDLTEKKLVIGYGKVSPTFNSGTAIWKNINANKANQNTLNYLNEQCDILESQVTNLLQHIPVDDDTAFVFQEKFVNTLKIDKDLSNVKPSALDTSKEQLIGSMDIKEHEWSSTGEAAVYSTDTDDTQVLTCTYSTDARVKTTKENHFTVKGTSTDLINIGSLNTNVITDTVDFQLSSVTEETISATGYEHTYGSSNVYYKTTHPDYCLFVTGDVYSYMDGGDHDDEAWKSGNYYPYLNAIKKRGSFDFSAAIQYHYDEIWRFRYQGSDVGIDDQDEWGMHDLTNCIQYHKSGRASPERMLYNAMYIKEVGAGDIIYLTTESGKVLNLYSGEYVNKTCYYGYNKSDYSNISDDYFIFSDSNANTVSDSLNPTAGAGYYVCSEAKKDTLVWFRIPIDIKEGTVYFTIHHYKKIDANNYKHVQQSHAYTSNINYINFLTSYCNKQIKYDPKLFYNTTDVFDISKVIKQDYLYAHYSLGHDYHISSIEIPGFCGNGYFVNSNSPSNNQHVYFYNGKGFIDSSTGLTLKAGSYYLKLVPEKACSIKMYSVYNKSGSLNAETDHYIMTQSTVGDISVNKKFYLDHSMYYTKYDSFSVEYKLELSGDDQYDTYCISKGDRYVTDFSGKLKVTSSGIQSSSVTKNVAFDTSVPLYKNFNALSATVTIKQKDGGTVAPIIPATLPVGFVDTEKVSDLFYASLSYVSDLWYIDDAPAYGAELEFSLLIGESDTLTSVFGAGLKKLIVQYQQDGEDKWYSFADISNDSPYITEYPDIKTCCIYKDGEPVVKTIKGTNRKFTKYMFKYDTEGFATKSSTDSWNFCSNRFRFRIIYNSPTYVKKTEIDDQVSFLLPITVTCGCKELYS